MTGPKMTGPKMTKENKEKLKQFKLQLKEANAKVKIHNKEYDKYLAQHDKQDTIFADICDELFKQVSDIEYEISLIESESQDPDIKNAITLLKDNGYNITKKSKK